MARINTNTIEGILAASKKKPTKEPKAKPTSTNPIAAAIPVAGVVNTPRPAATRAAAPTPTNAYLDAIMGKTTPAAVPATPVTTPTERAANDYLNLGPLGGLGAGVVAGVTGSPGVPETKTDTKIETKIETKTDIDTGKLTGTDTGITTPITLVSTQLDKFGNTIGFYSDGTSKTLMSSGRTMRSTVDEDAYAILTKTLTDAGLPDFAKIIQGYMDRDLGPNQAALEIRKEPIYEARFKGNKDRRAAGLNVLSEAEYLDLENSYMQTLKAYGFANELGTDAASRQAAMADLISGDTSALEFKERVDTIVTRVKNADPTVKATMTSFFGIKDEDLVKYFINPKENLPKLQEKVTAAEIGAAATSQNLATSRDAATALAQFGITQEQARQGYSSIGEILPTATKLGEIYGDQYTQGIAEQEVFQGLSSARRKREELARREAAAFSGSSGRLRTGRQQGNTGQF